MAEKNVEANEKYEETDGNITYIRRKSNTSIITNFSAFFLLSQGIIGGDIVRSIDIFHEGWIPGIILTIFAGILCTHCLRILIRSKYHFCKSLNISHLNYSQIMERALEGGHPKLRKFSLMSHYAVDCCFISCQLALCYFYTSKNTYWSVILEDLILQWFHKRVIIHVLFTYITIPLILTLCLRNLKIVAYACVLGTTISFSLLGYFYWNVLNDPSIFNKLDIQPPNIDNIPSYFVLMTIMIFSLEAVTVVCSLEGNLKHPKNFWGILNSTMFIAVFVQCSVGFLGYVSLSNTGRIEIWIIAVSEMSKYVSYGLHSFILVDILWRKTQKKILSNRYMLSILVLVITLIYLILSSVTIYIDYAVEIVLGISVPCLGIIFPAIIDISLKWPHNFKRGKVLFLKNLAIILIGVIIIVVAISPTNPFIFFGRSLKYRSII